MNDNFYILLGRYGIIHRTTPIYTKEPNGLIERINLTLMNKVRCLLIQSGLKEDMWGEALLAATYLYNITPHSALGFKSPYEIYYKRLPAIRHIKTWGSIAYYHTNKSLPSKLSPRKSMAIVIGYSEQKHYKLYNLKQKKIVWSRDPTILEGRFLMNQSDLANQEPGIKANENRFAKKRSAKQAANPIKKIARNTSKSTSLSTSKSASKETS